MVVALYRGSKDTPFAESTLRVRVVLRVWWGTTVKSEDLCISALSVVLCKLFCEKSVPPLRSVGFRFSFCYVASSPLSVCLPLAWAVMS